MKHGFLDKEKTQRYRCTTCSRTCSDPRPFGILRSKPDKIVQVVELLTEGCGIRSTARLARVHRDTVLRILKFAGLRAEKLLLEKLQDIQPESVQVDEIWTTVKRRLKIKPDPEFDTSAEGDFYTFLAMDAKTKLLFSPHVGKRNELNTEVFAQGLAKQISGRTQLTTDGFRPYKPKMINAFGNRIDFAQYYKEYNMLNATPKPQMVIGADGVSRAIFKEKKKREVFSVRSGSPDKSRISTSHIERTNLTLRLMNRRFNRETLCISKSLEYLNYSVFLFTAFYNFCKTHGTLGSGTTPAMASNLASQRWEVRQLFANT